MLSQESVNLVFSNLNSYPRESLDGKTPYDNFITEHGEEGRKFLEALFSALSRLISSISKVISFSGLPPSKLNLQSILVEYYVKSASSPPS